MQRKGSVQAFILQPPFLLRSSRLAFLGSGGPQYWWLDLAALIVLAVVVLIVPGMFAQNIVASLLLLLQVVVSVANEVLYHMSDMIFTLSLLGVANEGGKVFTVSMLNFKFIAGLSAIFIATVAALFFVGRSRKKTGIFLSAQVSVMLAVIYCMGIVAGINLFGAMLSTLKTADPNDPYYIYSDDSYLWETQFLSAKAFEKFGTFAFYYKNVSNFFSDTDSAAGNIDIDAFLEESAWHSSLRPYEGFDNIMTGKFAGQNLVVIVIESGEWYAINKEYTPTLYALATQGIAMTNYYTRDKTNHSEAMSILGSYPVNSDVTEITDHTLPFTAPNILGGDGYTSQYFHAMTLMSHGWYEDLRVHGDYTADLSDAEKAELSASYGRKGLELFYEKIDGYASTFVTDECYGYVASKYNEQGEIADKDLYLRYKCYQAAKLRPQ